jgi:hypothetical protein
LLLALVAFAGMGLSLAYAMRQPPAQAWPTVILVTVTAPGEPTRAPVVEVTPTFIPWMSVTRYVRVTGTQGLHLRIRAAPSTTAETVKLVPDGTRLIVAGEGRQADGSVWWPVRDPSDGKEGWAVSTYLVPDAGP